MLKRTVLPCLVCRLALLTPHGKIWEGKINEEQSLLTIEVVSLQYSWLRDVCHVKSYTHQIQQSSHPHHIINFKISPRQIFLSAAAMLLWVCVIETIKSVHSHLISPLSDLAYSINPHAHADAQSMAPWLNGWSFI